VISGISEGIGDSATATWLYKNLLQEIPKSLNKIATTLLDLKVHSDCLAAMVLQNSTMFLDMITAPPRVGLVPCSEKNVAFMLTNLTEIQNNVTDMEKTRDLRERAEKEWLSLEKTWLSPFLGHLHVLC
jgi:hypothetical protein